MCKLRSCVAWYRKAGWVGPDLCNSNLFSSVLVVADEAVVDGQQLVRSTLQPSPPSWPRRLCNSLCQCCAVYWAVADMDNFKFINDGWCVGRTRTAT